MTNPVLTLDRVSLVLPNGTPLFTDITEQFDHRHTGPGAAALRSAQRRRAAQSRAGHADLCRSARRLSAARRAEQSSGPSLFVCAGGAAQSVSGDAAGGVARRGVSGADWVNPLAYGGGERLGTHSPSTFCMTFIFILNLTDTFITR